MCKIAILQSHNPSSRDRIIKNAWAYFANTGETDGFGAAWISRSGRLGWCKSSSPLLSGALPSWASGFFASDRMDEPSDGKWLLIHGRTATCGVNLDNTHPMLDGCGHSALVHNGVVSSTTFHNVHTSCDSELLLHAWDEAGAKGLEQISGYFAFGLLLKRRDGWHAVIARDDKARLRVGKTSKGWVWATTDDALRVCKASPVADHMPMHAAIFTPNGECELASFSKASEPENLASRWNVASGRSARYGSELALWDVK